MKNLFKNRLLLKIAVVMTVVSGTMMLAGGRQLANNVLNANRPLVKVAVSGGVVRDKQLVPVEAAGQVESGETLSWTIDSINEGASAANNYRVVGQIPAGTVFVANSAKAENAAVTYSIDNGKTYVAQPTVPQLQADGTIKQVAAPVATYTQVRYEYADPLAVGVKQTVEYQVRVR